MTFKRIKQKEKEEKSVLFNKPKEEPEGKIEEEAISMKRIYQIIKRKKYRKVRNIVLINSNKPDFERRNNIFNRNSIRKTGNDSNFHSKNLKVSDFNKNNTHQSLFNLSLLNKDFALSNKSQLDSSVIYIEDNDTVDRLFYLRGGK